MRSEMFGGPLAGCKVMEIATMVAGPYAGQLLADMGAEVIKVEVLTGDPMRASLPIHGKRSAVFESFNRGKRSLAINIRTPEGLAAVHKLAAQVDVVLENSRPGVMDRLGLGYDDLKPINDRLIYLSVSGFGPTGPMAQMPTYDVVIQGISGFMYTQGQDGTPAHVRGGVADKITGVFGAMGVLGALYERNSTGVGQKVDVSMLNAYAAFMLPEVMTRFYFQDLPEDKRVNVTAGVFHNIVAQDGYATGFIIQRKELEGVAKAFGLPHLLEDGRFLTSTLLVQNQDQLFAEISKAACTMSRTEILARAVEFQIPIAPVNDMEDFFATPQAQHNQTYVNFTDGEAGNVRTLASFASFGSTPTDVRRMAPSLGEDTLAVLAELGFDEDALADLRKSGALG